MQTFLPYPDFKESAKCLDRQRLGKQRVEVLQLLKALTQGPTCTYDTECRAYIYGLILEGGRYVLRNTPWYNHPAARMWSGYERALVEYGQTICLEWLGRGYSDTCFDKMSISYSPNHVMPDWLGSGEFHAAHRSNLLRKDPTYYGQFNWSEPHNLPYVWPVT